MGNDMILVIFALAIVILIIGVLLWNNSYAFEEVGEALFGVGLTFAIISVIAIIALSCVNGNNYGIDQKIELYESENQQIEEDISILVNEYMKHEENIFVECSPDSSISLIALYPELKSNMLVEKQIEIYVSNTAEIKQLKSQKISASIVKWWLYFGSVDAKGEQK